MSNGGWHKINVDGNRVYCRVGGQDQAVAAFDKLTGKAKERGVAPKANIATSKFAFRAILAAGRRCPINLAFVLRAFAVHLEFTCFLSQFEHVCKLLSRDRLDAEAIAFAEQWHVNQDFGGSHFGERDGTR